MKIRIVPTARWCGAPSPSRASRPQSFWLRASLTRQPRASGPVRGWPWPWAQVEAAIYTQGCLPSQDPDCDVVDESPTREVELTSFWIMTTEVTLWMFQACIDAGVCSAAQIGTGTAECNSLSLVSSSPDLPVNCIEFGALEQFCLFIDAQELSAMRSRPRGGSAGDRRGSSRAPDNGSPGDNR